MTNLEGLIQQHQLKRHPEGGWYRELHRSTALVQRPDAAKRPGLTAILFLLPKDEISCWHRVGGADEAWTHIDGADLNLFQCTPNGSALLWVCRVIWRGQHRPIGCHPWSFADRKSTRFLRYGF